ncbi:hypothetical protein D9M72_593650 [compost metagenome]
MHDPVANITQVPWLCLGEGIENEVAHGFDVTGCSLTTFARPGSGRGASESPASTMYSKWLDVDVLLDHPTVTVDPIRAGGPGSTRPWVYDSRVLSRAATDDS